jgi:tetratricopeptide (TPR) repeat protein
MGTLREAQGRPAEAVDWYKKAAASDALWTTPLLKLAAIARASGDRDSALRYVTRVLDLDPTSPDANQARALQKQLQ